MTTTNNTTAIENFLSGLNTEIDVLNLINIEDINLSDAYNSIYEMIDNNSGFNIDVIYYSNAIEYLREYDPSLRESLNLASEYGYTAENLNSEVLASLLKSQNERESFSELESEINDFFSELEEEEEEDED